MRWFESRLPADNSVTIRAHGMGLLGLSIAGPRSRELLSMLTDEDVSQSAFKFLDFRRLNLGMIPALVSRVTFTGDLGYEFWVKPEFHGRLWDDIIEKGAAFGIKPFGSRAMRSLSLEKSFGSWATEYRPIYGPCAAGLDRFVNLKKAEFIGREAAKKEKDDGPAKKLVTFTVDVNQCDVMGNEPIYKEGEIVGYVTSGMYAHYTDRSVALGYIPTPHQRNLVGRISYRNHGRNTSSDGIVEPLFDPTASRMRGLNADKRWRTDPTFCWSWRISSRLSFCHATGIPS